MLSVLYTSVSNNVCIRYCQLLCTSAVLASLAEAVVRRLIIFGGRGADRKRLNDVHFLDIATWTWHRPNTDGTPPAPRSGAAAVFMGGQMILFGGYGAGARLNDLHILDLTSWQWQQPGLTGTAPSPRQSSGVALQGQLIQKNDDASILHNALAVFCLSTSLRIRIDMLFGQLALAP